MLGLTKGSSDMTTGVECSSRESAKGSFDVNVEDVSASVPSGMSSDNASHGFDSKFLPDVEGDGILVEETPPPTLKMQIRSTSNER